MVTRYNRVSRTAGEQCVGESSRREPSEVSTEEEKEGSAPAHSAKGGLAGGAPTGLHYQFRRDLGLVNWNGVVARRG